jgi:peptide deformylase
MAQIFQHETDHLDGILFTDTAKELEEIDPEVMKKDRAKKR